MNGGGLDRLDWGKGGGLLPAIVQDARSGRVLMLGYMNQESLRRTLETRRAVFFSRSRDQLWTKGETSGHFLDVVDVSADCDDDTILVLAHPNGPTCHKDTESCFARASLPQRHITGEICRFPRVVERALPADTAWVAKFIDGRRLQQRRRGVSQEKLSIPNVSGEHGIRRMPCLLANLPSRNPSLRGAGG